MYTDIDCPCSNKEPIKFVIMTIDEKIEEISSPYPQKLVNPNIKNYKINNNKRYRLF